MVRALLDGRKTQTRRLATSPCAKWEPGDRLYVREAWRTDIELDRIKPSALVAGEAPIWFEADRDNCDRHGRLRPGIHMPRWASRATLLLRDVTVSPLQSISAFDAESEGAFLGRCACPQMQKQSSSAIGSAFRQTWCAIHGDEFRYLWDGLHDREGERWSDNPDVVALTFEVLHGNVDQLGELE